MSSFNVGVIGIGDISDVYFDNLKLFDIVRVLGCAGRDLGKSEAKAAQHGIPRAYRDAMALIADPDIDIILNLTHPAVHAELNLAALAAGKHVYSEKPLAASFADGQRIMALAKDKGLRVGCAPDTFLGGRLQTCRKLIDDGVIGQVTAASAFAVSHGMEWFHPNPAFVYQQDCGPLLDIGPYYVTALLSLLGTVESGCALSNRAFAQRTMHYGPQQGETFEVGVDTHISGNLAFSNGAVATIVTSFDVWDSELPRLEIYGTKGTLCLRDVDPCDGPNLFGGTLLLRTESNYRWKNMPRQTPGSDWIEVESRHPFNSVSHARNSRGIGLVDMAYAIRDQRPERASGAMALHALEVMDKLINSARSRTFFNTETRFERPAALPVDFPASEG